MMVGRLAGAARPGRYGANWSPQGREIMRLKRTRAEWSMLQSSYYDIERQIGVRTALINLTARAAA